jgi:DNA helicase HerA-like ATPase
MRSRAGPVPVSLVPLLVMILRDPERAGGGDLGRDPVGEAGLLRVTRRERRRLLLRPEGEDRGAVLAAAVGPLAITARGIVGAPEVSAR